MTTEPIDIVVSERGSKQAAANIKGIGKEADGTTRLVDFMKKALATIGLALGVRELIGFADAATRVRSVLKLATSSTEEFDFALKAVYKSAKQTGTPVEALANLYDSMATVGKDFNATQEDTAGIVDTVAKAFAAEGKSAATAGGAINALSKSLVKGEADARGIISVLNESNLLAETLAAQFGLTAGQLVQAINAGVITSQQLFEALRNSAGDIDKAFASTERTIEQMFASLQVGLTQALDQSATFKAAIAGVGNALMFLIDNLDILIPLVQYLAVLWGVNTVLALRETLVASTLYTAAVSAATGATRAQAISNAVASGSMVALRTATLQATGAMAAFNVVWRANPFGAALTILTLIGTAFIVLYQRSETFRFVVDKLGVGLGVVVGWLQRVLAIVGPLIPGFNVLAAAIGKNSVAAEALGTNTEKTNAALAQQGGKLLPTVTDEAGKLAKMQEILSDKTLSFAEKQQQLKILFDETGEAGNKLKNSLDGVGKSMDGVSTSAERLADYSKFLAENFRGITLTAEYAEESLRRKEKAERDSAESTERLRNFTVGLNAEMLAGTGFAPALAGGLAAVGSAAQTAASGIAAAANSLQTFLNISNHVQDWFGTGSASGTKASISLFSAADTQQKAVAQRILDQIQALEAAGQTGFDDAKARAQQVLSQGIGNTISGPGISIAAGTTPGRVFGNSIIGNGSGFDTTTGISFAAVHKQFQKLQKSNEALALVNGQSVEVLNANYGAMGGNTTALNANTRAINSFDLSDFFEHMDMLDLARKNVADEYHDKNVYDNLQGFDDGGTMRVRGAPGRDRNRVSMRLSEGELVKITPRRDANKSSVSEQRINVTLAMNFNGTVDSDSIQANQAMIARQTERGVKRAIKLGLV